MVIFTEMESAVLEALSRACSQDTNILKPAEQQLRDNEAQPGFYSAILVS